MCIEFGLNHRLTHGHLEVRTIQQTFVTRFGRATFSLAIGLIFRQTSNLFGNFNLFDFVLANLDRDSRGEALNGNR